MSSSISHYFRETEPPHSLLPSVKEQLKSLNLSNDADAILSIETESCFNVQTAGNNGSSTLSSTQKEHLEWLLAETFEKEKLRTSTIFPSSSSQDNDKKSFILEFGPRMSFASAFSSNAVSICHACGLNSINRFEKSRRYRFVLDNDDTKKNGNHSSSGLTLRAMSAIRDILHDRMTEQEYKEPIMSFDVDVETEKVTYVPIMSEGRKALEKINTEKGLGFDDFDLDYYTKLFKVSFFVDKQLCLGIQDQYAICTQKHS